MPNKDLVPDLHFVALREPSQPEVSFPYGQMALMAEMIGGVLCKRETTSTVGGKLIPVIDYRVVTYHDPDTQAQVFPEPKPVKYTPTLAAVYDWLVEQSEDGLFQRVIPYSTERRRLDKLATLIRAVNGRQYTHPETAEQWLQYETNLVTRSIVEMPGLDIRMVKERDFRADKAPKTKFICTTFVFRSVYGDTWDPEDYRVLPGRRIRDDTDRFLEEKGYQRLSGALKMADIVAYQHVNGITGAVITNHFGIYAGDDRVISKPGGFPIIEHPIDLMPNYYGNRVVGYERAA